MVTRALEAPDKTNIFSSSVSWICHPSQCFVTIAETHFSWSLHRILHVIISKNLFFLTRFVLWSSFLQFRGQELEQVFVDIVRSPRILICLVEQLWIGQAIDPCLYTAPYEAFACLCTMSTPSQSADFQQLCLHLACCQVQEKMRQRNILHVGKCKRRCGSVPSRMLASAREDAAA